MRLTSTMARTSSSTIRHRCAAGRTSKPLSRKRGSYMAAPSERARSGARLVSPCRGLKPPPRTVDVAPFEKLVRAFEETCPERDGVFTRGKRVFHEAHTQGPSTDLPPHHALIHAATS